MANSRVLYTGNGSTSAFNVPFGYINKSHVSVTLNGVALLTPMEFSWNNDTTIQMSLVPEVGDAILIKRTTPRATRLVDFTNGSVLTEAELDLAHLQHHYAIQELYDAYEAHLEEALVRLGANGGVVTTNAEAVIDEMVALVLESALLAALQSNIGAIDTNAESIASLAAHVDEVVADLGFDPTYLETAILDETNARVDADTATANKIALLGAGNAGGTAFILNTATVLRDVEGGTSLSAVLSAIEANVGDNEAAILAEQTARADGDSALSTSLSALTASIPGDIAAAVATEATARASADSALSSTLDTLSATVGANTAAISAEATARVDGDNAVAATVTTLGTTVGDNTTAISTQAISIDGIQGKYAVKVDVNGHVSGFGLISTANDGAAVSEFIVQANKFAIVDPGNSLATPIVPFSVSGGVVYMTDVVIQNANIASLTVDKLTGGTLGADFTFDGTMQMGNGLQVMESTLYMRVMGLGFGADANLIDWYGLKPAGATLQDRIDACTALNCLFCITTAGAVILTRAALRNVHQTDLASASYAETRIQPRTTTAGFKLDADGYLYSFTEAGGYVQEYKWLVSGDPTKYSVRVINTTGTLDTGDSLGWQQLNVDREFKITRSTVGSDAWEGTVELRFDDDGLTVALVDITLDCTLETAVTTLPATASFSNTVPDGFAASLQRYFETDGEIRQYTASYSHEGEWNTGWSYPGIGSTHWIRCTYVSGTAHYVSGSGLGSWLQLNAQRGWVFTNNVSSSTKTAVYRFEIATDSGGATIVATQDMTISLTVESP